MAPINPNLVLGSILERTWIWNFEIIGSKMRVFIRRHEKLEQRIPRNIFLANWNCIPKRCCFCFDIAKSCCSVSCAGASWSDGDLRMRISSFAHVALATMICFWRAYLVPNVFPITLARMRSSLAHVPHSQVPSSLWGIFCELPTKACRFSVLV
jgi:hypothetical protein